jgi:hypothetical protein
MDVLFESGKALLQKRVNQSMFGRRLLICDVQGGILGVYGSV